EFVPGFTTLLIEFEHGHSERIGELAAQTIDFLKKHARAKPATGELHCIPVSYTGTDLHRVAALNKITEKQVIAFHTEPTYRVILLGFAPGFPYLGELHHKLRTPRLETPRPVVAAGSVAIGGEHTGIYTVDSPGGWNILGQTTVKVFDPEKLIAGTEENAF